jgi:hypothetical protein
MAADSAGEWDARAELSIGVMIERYLHENPPPTNAKFAGDFADWGRRLRGWGEYRLRAIAASPLRAVDSEQGAEEDRWRVWNETPADERRHWLLNALGDDELSGSEIAARVAEAHDCHLFAGRITPTLIKMLDQGELTSTKALKVPHGTAWLWMYRRRTELSPDLAALEQAPSDEGSE